MQRVVMAEALMQRVVMLAGLALSPQTPGETFQPVHSGIPSTSCHQHALVALLRHQAQTRGRHQFQL